jgi:hypothetical protein
MQKIDNQLFPLKSGGDWLKYTFDDALAFCYKIHYFVKAIIIAQLPLPTIAST